jgi:hypothetical protein
VSYDSFGLLSVDGAILVGPAQLGAELAYMRGRSLLAERAEDGALLPGKSDLLQLGVRAEWIESRWVVVLEGLGGYALSAPEPARGGWLYMRKGRQLFGAAAFAAYSFGDRDFTVELGGAALNGPSLLLAPRLELRLSTELFCELGAFLVEGERAAGPGMPGSVTGPYDDTDQVYLGVRWLP